jgi:hypothetical protein
MAHIVVNHLHLREPAPERVLKETQDAVQLVVDAGALSARVVKIDDKHLILILEFCTAEDADRVAREVGGPWVREHIVPLLAGETERNASEEIASAVAGS